jgi:hypothetical protein
MTKREQPLIGPAKLGQLRPSIKWTFVQVCCDGHPVDLLCSGLRTLGVAATNFESRRSRRNLNGKR